MVQEISQRKASTNDLSSVTLCPLLHGDPSGDFTFILKNNRGAVVLTEGNGFPFRTVYVKSPFLSTSQSKAS
jgi:hypothetical protein